MARRRANPALSQKIGRLFTQPRAWLGVAALFGGGMGSKFDEQTAFAVEERRVKAAADPKDAENPKGQAVNGCIWKILALKRRNAVEAVPRKWRVPPPPEEKRTGRKEAQCMEAGTLLAAKALEELFFRFGKRNGSRGAHNLGGLCLVFVHKVRVATPNYQYTTPVRVLRSRLA